MSGPRYPTGIFSRSTDMPQNLLHVNFTRETRILARSTFAIFCRKSKLSSKVSGALLALR